MIAGMFLLASRPTHAQPRGSATLIGAVVDADTQSPLEAVHVFVEGSMLGTTTDSTGHFTLAPIPLGAQHLRLSMVGYLPETRALMFRAPRTFTLNFSLRQEVMALKGVTVSAKRDPVWRKHLVTFEHLFLGESARAAETRILNPETIDFIE